MLKYTIGETTMKYIITIRHGESFKNLKNIDGGKGEKLTDKGRAQIEKSASIIRQIMEKNPNLAVSVYRSCDREQITETADIISGVTGTTHKRDDRFAPIRLGIFNGMSSARQQELYPVAAREMAEWCNGERDILDVHVEGMQDPRNHVDNIISFINDLPDNSITILIGTRSDISAVKNIEQGNHPSIKDSYRFYPTEFAEVQCCAFDGKEYEQKFKISCEDIPVKGDSGNEK